MPQKRLQIQFIIKIIPGAVASQIENQPHYKTAALLREPEPVKEEKSILEFNRTEEENLLSV